MNRYTFRRFAVAQLIVALIVGTAVSAPPEDPPRRPLDVQDIKPHPVPDTTPAEIEASIGRGIDFLLRLQKRDGSWGDAHRSKDENSYTPTPEGFNANCCAVTSMCVQALWESGNRAGPVMASIDRGEKWMRENLPKLRRSSTDVLYNNWAHPYAIQSLVTMYRAKPDDAERKKWIRELIVQQIGMLQRFEAVDGGWGYYDFTYHTQQSASLTCSFTSATVLVALHRAQEIGIEVPRKMVDRAIASILRQQKPDLSYLYGEYLHWRPEHPVNRPQGSLGRTQACNVALRLWDGDKRLTDDIFVACLDRLFARELWLDMGRKRPIPHESYYAVAAYFFYYGHYYAALCIETLPPEQRAPLQQQLAHILLNLQETDGSWWDYPMFNYHQQYGTAFGIMSLVHCRPAAPAKASESKAATAAVPAIKSPK